ncbi:MULTISPECIES: DUF1652 domain-containing protein [unclassified Pseudomonas]|uniref:DUF1652 domain-containing protein n=1 Tax=unclassified Pseudomonas TaxID=196821 RepID=UPI0018E69782|nr:DUF1652 domain-containing protein [Pseudomonas sp. CCOS 191]MBI6952178.1 DUF1652 domain-containing protein [Pseudomonas sp. CCOS 191]
MSLIGVSMLEMRQMIEQACLPDCCEVSCPDGQHLTIRLGQGSSLDECLTVTGVPIASLNTCHDLLGLVSRVKAQRDASPGACKAIA